MSEQKEKTLEERFEMLMASFEKFRAEADKRAAEANKEMQELRESQAETDRKLQKLSEKVDATTEDATTENVTGIAKSNSMVTEETIFNSLNKDKTFGGIKFDEIERNVKLKSKMLNLQCEYAILLTNDDTIAIIEVKWWVRPEDVTKFTMKYVANFRNLFPMFANYKIVLGIGGMAFEDNAEDIAKASGVGVIKVLTDSVEYYTEGMRVY